MLCHSCTAKECRSLGREGDTIEIECVSCDGEGCEKCENGFFHIDGCPNKFCSRVVRSLDYLDLWKKGMPPITGGVLDQSASFINLTQFFDTEERRVANERVSQNPH